MFSLQNNSVRKYILNYLEITQWGVTGLPEVQLTILNVYKPSTKKKQSSTEGLGQAKCRQESTLEPNAAGKLLTRRSQVSAFRRRYLKRCVTMA